MRLPLLAAIILQAAATITITLADYPPARPPHNGPPYMVLVKNDISDCSGVLVAADRLLTGAHCAFGAFATSFLRDDANELIVVKVYMTAPDARERVAVQTLRQPMPIKIQPAQISLNERCCLSGRTLTAYGFGRNSADGRNYERLRPLKVTVTKYHGDGLISLTVDGREGAICNGDSGGPLVNCKGQVVAIIARRRQEECSRHFTAITLASVSKMLFRECDNCSGIVAHNAVSASVAIQANWLPLLLLLLLIGWFQFIL